MNDPRARIRTGDKGRTQPRLPALRFHRRKPDAARVAPRTSGLLKLGLAIGWLFLAGCSSGPLVRSERDPGVDFSSYATFGFFDVVGTDPAGYETLVTRTLKASTRREMQARGYRYLETGADLLVNFNAKLVERLDVTRTPAPTADYYGYRAYSTWQAYDLVADQYSEGTLNIDVVDARSHRLVWEGVAIGRVTDKTYRDREAAIDRAVVDILARFPVPPGR